MNASRTSRSRRPGSRRRGAAAAIATAAAVIGFLNTSGVARADDGCRWDSGGSPSCTIDVPGYPDPADPLPPLPWPPDPPWGGGTTDPGGGGGGGGGDPTDDVAEWNRQTGAAMRIAPDALRRPSNGVADCNRFISGDGPRADDILDAVSTARRLRDDHRGGPTPYHLADASEGNGANGTIELYLPFHTYPYDPSIYEGQAPFNPPVDPPLTADEYRAMALLHELAHLTGQNQHGYDDAVASTNFNAGIVLNCLRPNYPNPG
jgi:hypothetical protein